MSLRDTQVARLVNEVRYALEADPTDAGVQRGMEAALVLLGVDVRAVLAEVQPHSHISPLSAEICTVCVARRRLEALFGEEGS